MRKSDIETELRTAEVFLESLRGTLSHNQTVVLRLREQTPETWPELSEVMREQGLTQEQVLAAAERRLAQQSNAIVEGETQLTQLRLLARASIVPAGGTA